MSGQSGEDRSINPYAALFAFAHLALCSAAIRLASHRHLTH